MSGSGIPPYPVLNVIGLMSGTSVDGIDAACVRIRMESEPLQLADCTVLGTHSVDFLPEIRHRLLALMADSRISLAELSSLQVETGHLFGQTARQLIERLKTQGIPVNLVASHGQTVYHQPPVDDLRGHTLQIGQPAEIAALSGVPVIADFRPGDMAVGGHGAPLVPFADVLLFQKSGSACAVQNIGGIGNVTVVPAVESGKAPLAFDTGPGNMVIDGLVQALFQQEYDKDGLLARQGLVSEALLQTMLADPYFNQPPPKTTGRERFGKPYTDRLLTEWPGISPLDWLATATHFTAASIVQAYERFVLPEIKVSEVIVGGGGAYNLFLMEQLAEAFSPWGIKVKRHEDYGVSSRYKEAIAFALLGYARYVGIPNNLPGCTGARQPVVMGGLWQPARDITSI